MKITQRAINLIDGTDTYFTFAEAEECPICHAKIVGRCLSTVIWKRGVTYYASVTNYCSGCCDVFINYYITNKNRNINSSSALYFIEKSLIKSAPEHFEKRIFEDSIKTVSPNFDIIYNQAKQSETMELNQIAGIGYHKSIEFLVKDFTIKYNPNDENKIKNMPLSSCIKKYIDDSRIKNLVEKAIWIDNNETYYVRQYEDKDIADMKKLIDVLIYFISMVLITEDTETIQET